MSSEVLDSKSAVGVAVSEVSDCVAEAVASDSESD